MIDFRDLGMAKGHVRRTLQSAREAVALRSDRDRLVATVGKARLGNDKSIERVHARIRRQFGQRSVGPSIWDRYRNATLFKFFTWSPTPADGIELGMHTLFADARGVSAEYVPSATVTRHAAIRLTQRSGSVPTGKEMGELAYYTAVTVNLIAGDPRVEDLDQAMLPVFGGVVPVVDMKDLAIITVLEPSKLGPRRAAWLRTAEAVFSTGTVAEAAQVIIEGAAILDATRMEKE